MTEDIRVKFAGFSCTGVFSTDIILKAAVLLKTTVPSPPHCEKCTLRGENRILELVRL